MQTIALYAVGRGAESFVSVVTFAEVKVAWRRISLPLPCSIPRHDTFWHIFAVQAPQTYQARLLAWVQTVAPVLGATVVIIDDKTLRGSHTRRLEQAALHITSVWAKENCPVLG